MYIAVQLINQESHLNKTGRKKMTQSNKKTVRSLKVTNLPQGKGYVPGVRLAGQYLANLGFKIGDVVEITPNGDGCLNIRRVGA